MRMLSSKTRKAGAALAVVATLAGAAFALREPALARLMSHVHEGHHGHGADGMGHDEVNMPGLRGENATPEESAEIAVLFRNFQTLTREVTNLPDGIRTVTRSSDIEVTDEGIVVVQTSTDPEVVAALQLHATEVSDMAARGMQAVHERMMRSGG